MGQGQDDQQDNLHAQEHRVAEEGTGRWSADQCVVGDDTLAGSWNALPSSLSRSHARVTMALRAPTKTTRIVGGRGTN